CIAQSTNIVTRACEQFDFLPKAVSLIRSKPPVWNKRFTHGLFRQTTPQQPQKRRLLGTPEKPASQSHGAPETTSVPTGFLNPLIRASDDRSIHALQRF